MVEEQEMGEMCTRMLLKAKSMFLSSWQEMFIGYLLCIK